MLYLSRRTKSKELGILRKDEKKKGREINRKNLGEKTHHWYLRFSLYRFSILVISLCLQLHIKACKLV